MRLLLAPMQGVIDHTMRALLTDLGGIDRCVTEFVRVGEQILPPRVFYRLCPELASGGRTAAGVPVYVQLLGGKAAPMAANAARCAELGAPGVDLNFGCPAKTVNRSDGGAIILREPQRVSDIVSQVRKAVPATVPVTVKIRLGFEDRSRFLDNVVAITEAGATELAIHARTRDDGYRPPAWWDEIARAREVTSIPLIANGEIWRPQDALNCQQASRCRDLMLGRGALSRPDLPRLVQAAVAGEPLQALEWLDIVPLLQRFFEVNLASYEQRHAANPLKQWLAYLRNTYPEAALLFEDIKRLHDPAAIQLIIAGQLGARKTHSQHASAA